MPAPKDPEKYAEWKRKLSESHKNKTASKATKDKLSARRMGRTLSESTKAKIGAANSRPNPKKSAAMKGRTVSQATKDKIAATLKGRKLTPEQRERHLAALQRNRENITPEQLEKMQTARLGQKNSEEHNRKISEANKGTLPPNTGRKYTDEEKQRIYANVYGNTWSRGRKMPEHVKQMLLSPEVRAKNIATHKEKFAALSPEEQGKRLEAWVRAGRKNRDTAIELFVASQLDTMEATYEKQKRIGRYFVDFFLPEQNLVIECNGCFWHCCEACGFSEEYNPGKREYDRKRIDALEAKGYTVCILWEHDLEPYIEDVGKVVVGET
jgi:G:T-mismatch repair DNA endonuclease (very short patch repair protein)